MPNLQRQFGPLDEAARMDGDTFFRGVNERLPATAPEMAGYFTRAKNLRFTNGVAEPRLGIGILRWGKTNGQTAFTEVYGQPAQFYNVDGLVWTIIAADSGVWMTRPNNVAVAVPLPAGVTLTASTFKMFVVCGRTLVMLRGPDADPLACTNLTTGFEVITQSADGDGTEPIPRSSFGLYFANRLLLIVDRDNVAVSDEGDYTRYEPILNTFKINEGDNEELVAIAEMDAQTLLFLKERSAWYVTGIGSNLANAVGPKALTRQYGCIAPFSAVKVGTDVFWWSEQGLVSVTLTQQNEIQARTHALTDDLPVTLARLNRLFQSAITCEFHDGFIYVAVPLDDAKIYGPELISGATYSLGSGSQRYATISGLTAGATYLYTPQSAVDDGFYNWPVPSGTLTEGGLEFTTANTGIAVLGTASAAVTASLKQVLHSGVCTAVLVYDTQQGAWAGVDESAATRVKGWFKPVVQGAQQLCFLSPDGWLRVYGQGYEDETVQAVTTPYVDVLVTTTVAFGETIQVNGGGLFTADSFSVDNISAIGLWATATSLARAGNAQNLWRDATNQDGGYDPSAVGFITAPNTTPSQLLSGSTAWGVRFTATNGVLPDVKINGVSVTVPGLYGTSDWAYVEPHSGNEIVNTPIETDGRTRAYECQDAQRNRFLSAQLLMQTWSPTYTISTVANGVARTEIVRDAITLSRTALSDLSGGSWDTSNAADDHGAAGRADYSVVLPATGMNLDPTGVNYDLHQDVSELVPVNVASHWLQVRLSNTTGRCVLRAVLMSAVDAQRTTGQVIA